jgi:protein-S-isoprenylcysteine O-methyltransferase Ste14
MIATTKKRAARLDAIIGSLVFLVVAPGLVAGFVPWIISRWQVREFPGDAVFRPLGLALITVGALVLLEAFARFALEGFGTPAPVYPTDRLITRGAYRFVRNPMYLAVEALILGQAALFGVFDLVIYAAMIAVAFHLFVVWVEEPTLRRHFPADYRRYSANVHRWLPRFMPWRSAP